MSLLSPRPTFHKVYLQLVKQLLLLIQEKINNGIVTGWNREYCFFGKVFDSPSYCIVLYCISRTGVGLSWHKKFFRSIHVLYIGSRTVISSTFMSENNQLMCNLIEIYFWCYPIIFCRRRKIIRFWAVMWNFNWMNPEVRYIQLYRHR